VQIQIDVVDANQAAIAQADCGLVYVDDKTLNQLIQHFASGTTVDIPISAKVPRVSLTVSKADYATEQAVLSGESGSSWRTSNAAITVTSSGAALRVRVTLGCVRFAPGKYYPPGTTVGICENAGGVLMEAAGSDYKYSGVWLNDESMSCLSDPVFGDPNAKEWTRLNHQTIGVPIARHGQLMFVEFGYPAPNGSGRPKLLAAVWAPSKQLTPPINAVVFYSPNTGEGYPADRYPYASAYPYRLRLLNGYAGKACSQAAPVSDLIQPYTALGTQYLIAGYKIVYQLIAAGRTPIVIMPIQPSSDWGPIGGKEGLGRLVVEVVRFLFAQGLCATRPRVLSALRFGPGGVTLFPPETTLTDDAVPGLDHIRVSVSAFSAGIGPIFTLIAGLPRKSEVDTQYPVSLFASPASVLDGAWRELWDVDGGVLKFGTWASAVKSFTTWQNAGSGRRIIRSYHSQDTYTAPANGLVDPAVVKRVSGTAGFIEEGQSRDGNTTWVFFSNSYLNGDKKDPGHQKTIPEFGASDAHHFVPTIAFAHAARFPVT
jgi:hypothetical protein